MLTHSESTLSRISNHFTSLIKGETSFNPLDFALDPGDDDGGEDDQEDISFCFPSSFERAQTSSGYVFWSLSGIELSFHLIMLIVLVFNIAVGVPLVSDSWSFLVTAAKEYYVVARATILIAYAYYAAGWMTDGEFFENLSGAFSNVGECIASAITSMTALEWAIFVLYVLLAIGILCVEALVDVLTASGIATTARVLIALASVTLFLLDFYNDCFDSDTIVG